MHIAPDHAGFLARPADEPNDDLAVWFNGFPEQ
jgi:hypothetical protein